jgi:hypothetical protein
MVDSMVCPTCKKTISTHVGDFPCKLPGPNVANYRCRNSYVLIKCVKLDQTSTGLAMPDTSIHGKEFHVTAKGPAVVDLEIGDKVMVTADARKTDEGDLTVSYYPLPNDKDYFVVDQKYVALILWSKKEKK